MSGAIDLSFLSAKPVVTLEPARVHLHLVGCGGTGSWLAPTVARVAHTLVERGAEVRVTFQDHDTVEDVNVPRQNFCFAEIGSNKAETLAARYAAAWGIEIAARSVPFTALDPKRRTDWLRVVMGCVDNAAARVEIQKSLGRAGYDGAPALWWLDCGNWKESGQVLLGCTADRKQLDGAFALGGACTALPSPALQSPELLVARPEEADETRLSCAELAARNEQSLAVNQMVAAIAGDYLLRLLVSRDLKKFATYFDQPSGSSRSSYTTPEAVAAAVGPEAPRRRRARAGSR